MPRIGLNDRKLSTLKATGVQTDYFDKALPGFGVRVASTGRKTFILLHRVNGRLQRLTLKDPVKRAEYLLEIEGIKIADERKAHPVAPSFLVEIMELREGLEEARASGDEARVAALGVDVRERSGRAMAEVNLLFTRFDDGDRSVLPAIADALVALRYYRRFLDELEAHEEQNAEGLS